MTGESVQSERNLPHLPTVVAARSEVADRATGQSLLWLGGFLRGPERSAAADEGGTAAPAAQTTEWGEPPQMGLSCS